MVKVVVCMRLIRQTRPLFRPVDCLNDVLNELWELVIVFCSAFVFDSCLIRRYFVNGGQK